MSLIGMPVLILNLGSEMVYILDQVTNFHRNLLRKNVIINAVVEIAECQT